MNSFTANVYAADAIAQYQIDSRVQEAQRRAQVRSVRAARRAARHVSKPLAPQSSHDLPWWTLRFLTPAR